MDRPDLRVLTSRRGNLCPRRKRRSLRPRGINHNSHRRLQCQAVSRRNRNSRRLDSHRKLTSLRRHRVSNRTRHTPRRHLRGNLSHISRRRPPATLSTRNRRLLQVTTGNNPRHRAGMDDPRRRRVSTGTRRRHPEATDSHRLLRGGTRSNRLLRGGTRIRRPPTSPSPHQVTTAGLHA